MEKAINALMLKGWSKEGSKGGREGDREGRVKIRIKRMRIQKSSLIPKNRSKRKKHCRSKTGKLKSKQRNVKETSGEWE